MVGAPPTLEWVAVDRLKVDPVYQRAANTAQSRRLIVRMQKRWNWALCQPLVVARRLDGGLFILDGQHRYLGAIERGDIPHLPCVIIAGADHSTEAETFVALNTQRQSLSQGNIFNAMLSAGDEDAIRIGRLLEETGWRMARSSATNKWKPGELFCGPRLTKWLKSDGEEVVRNALTALREAYHDKVVTCTVNLIDALILIYREDAKYPGFDPDLLIEALATVEPNDWLELAMDARQANPALSRREAIAVAMIEEYDALKKDRR